MKEAEYESISRKALKRLIPGRREKEEILSITKTLVQRLNQEIKKRGIENVEVKIEGSIAKNTWTSGDRDIDIFILFPKEFSKENATSIGLDIAKTQFKKWEERYAEHPYIRGQIDSYRIDVVPSFKIRDISEMLTAVDRTPLHTEYVNKHLAMRQLDDVRLLKGFMKGIGVYGAEIKISGFSGYLGELLIIKYGAFIQVLKSCSNWKEGEIIDIEKHYEDSQTIRRVFSDEFIVVDPVDKDRNVAAALNSAKLNEFTAAAYAFLKRPTLRFFFPEERKPFTSEEIRKIIEARGTDVLLLLFEVPDVVPDILWGQLYKSIKAIKQILIQEEFRVTREDVWSDEEKIAAMAFELENANLPKVRTHMGPPVGSSDQDIFLGKYSESDRVLSGPWIESGRWFVELKREHTDAKQFLVEELRMNIDSVGLGKYVRRKIEEDYEIYRNEEIAEVCKKNIEFSKFISQFFRKTPTWF
ncbi:MAG: CCA tRNA nucleotidyltransferase [Candidatus Hodarchaeota archaeon]